MAKKINHLLKTKEDYTVAGTLWIEYAGERSFGKGRMELLELIGTTGSINKAAKEMKMSYKKAWNMVSDLNTQWNQPMVITQSGGEGGGGSSLTKAAIDLIAYHVAMRKRFHQFLAAEKQKLLNN
jgi:molybdate transport system regulatory protein